MLKTLSPEEQDAVITDAAVAQNEGSPLTTYGLPAATLLSAASILALTGDQGEPFVMKDRVTTSPAMDGHREGAVAYVDPMGDRRIEAMGRGTHRISVPRPRGVLRRR